MWLKRVFPLLDLALQVAHFPNVYHSVSQMTTNHRYGSSRSVVQCFFFALLLVSNWTIYFRFVATEKCNMQSNGCGWLAALLNRTRPLSKRSATEVKHMHIGKLLPRAYNNIHVIPIKQLHFFVFGCIFCCCWFENERKKWTRGWKENFIVHYSVHSSVWNSVAKSNEIPSAQLKPS